MTTPIPQRKYFDTEKKVFPENQDDYITNNFGVVFNIGHNAYGRSDAVILTKAENVIKVPFTGCRKIYAHDILRVPKKMLQMGCPNIFEVYFNTQHFAWAISNEVVGPIRPIWLAEVTSGGECEIIGSALTNPELLNEN